MREIEIKARVSNIHVLKSTLEQMGCEFTEPVVQKDKIFIRKGDDIESTGRTVLRIREKKKKKIINS